MTVHLDFFALSIEPFSKEIDDKDLWLPPSKKGLVDDLVDAVEARESVLLTGEPGVGKTCVLRALRHALPADRFRLIGLCVDPDLTEGQIAEHAREYHLEFPIGRDRGLIVARRYGASVTPEAVVLDDAGKVRYRGRIDDLYAARRKKNPDPTTHELRDAIRAVLDGREVERPEVEAVGCPLPEVGEPVVRSG